MVRLNKVKERYIYLSPTVQAGWEDESNIGDFELTKILGKGAFGKVMKCVHNRSKLVYAIKEIDKRNLKENNMIQQINNEVKIMYQLNHPNILKLYNHFEDDKSIYLVLELAQGGQMYQILWKQPGKRFSEQRAANYIFQLCLALEKCHNQKPHPILHRDIKPENILLDDKNQIKLADFGWSNFLPKNQDIRETFCGTLDYLAPEMLHQQGYDHKVDIWSVGVLVFEILTGKSPFAPSDRQLDAAYVDKTTRKNIMNLNYQFPSDFPPLAKDLVQKILVTDPNKRLTLEQIMQHPWITAYCKVVKQPEPSSFEMDRAKQIVKSVDLEEFIGKNQEKAAFTAEQIYNCSRPDSIINVAYPGNQKTQNTTLNNSNMSNLNNTSASGEDIKQKMINNLTDKCQKLESKVNSLSIANEKKQMDIEILKKQLAQSQKSDNNQDSISVSELQQKLKQMENKYQQLKSQNDFQWNKFQEAEKKNRELMAMMQNKGDNQNTQDLQQQLQSQKDSNEQLKKQVQELTQELSKYKNGSGSLMNSGYNQYQGNSTSSSMINQQSGQGKDSPKGKSKKDAELMNYLEQLKQKHDKDKSNSVKNNDYF
ncbi:Protein kinase-like domain [Pseudocohnilembus persalinus]|uniref:Aurora kinase n=1 Tax=Pseudocohnilembus persalinus TaxID=266149 RepID=A0A0V0R2Q5_PSEPJ|nr:Protein kinase-like domain [Pseudocohnilembus persalinus]|eukprot:KRX08685.1 Protein kinase-like domain [Pseudocohnilembus persalinus]